MKHSIAALLLALIAGACASTTPQATPEQTAWWARRDAHPTTFTVPDDRAEQVWQRAIECIAQNSEFPIQTQTETLIQSGTPTGTTNAYDTRIAISATRVHVDDAWRFTFTAAGANPYSGKLQSRYAHMCAYIADTGETFPGP